MDEIIILGYGGHGGSVADCIVRSGRYHIAGYTDREDKACGYPWLGTDADLPELYASGYRYAALGVGFIGGSRIRDLLVRMAKEIGFVFPVIADPSAVIAEDASVGEGTFVGKNAVINAGADVGSFCIVNTGAIVEHQNVIGDYTHISVGTVLCGDVSVGSHAMVGANTTVIQGKTIGDGSIVGAGSVVVSPIPGGVIAYGNPCRIRGEIT